MKMSFLLITLFSLPTFAAIVDSNTGDCRPVQWHLPLQGKDCIIEATFGKPVENILWRCSDQRYLMTVSTVTEGEWKGCQIFKKLLIQNRASEN